MTIEHRRNEPSRFGEAFGRYVVIHAPWLNKERRQHFEAELSRAGVCRYQVVEPLRISDADASAAFEGRHGELSLLLTFIGIIEQSERDDLESVVIFEDDIVFRKDFQRLWSEVETAVETAGWDVLVLHRSGAQTVVEDPRSPVALVPVVQNINAHCVIVNRGGYAAMVSALRYCLEKGYPADFFYGVFTHDRPGRLVATTKNLTGQASGLRSSLQNGRTRPRIFFGEFDCYRSRTEAIVLGTIRKALSIARWVVASLRR